MPATNVKLTSQLVASHSSPVYWCAMCLLFTNFITLRPNGACPISGTHTIAIPCIFSSPMSVYGIIVYHTCDWDITLKCRVRMCLCMCGDGGNCGGLATSWRCYREYFHQQKFTYCVFFIWRRCCTHSTQNNKPSVTYTMTSQFAAIV